MADPPVLDRRAHPRHDALDRPARIAWRTTPARYSKIQATLLDIGPGGGRAAPESPPVGPTIWVGLTGLPFEWIRAEVLADEFIQGRRVCRFAFREPCTAGFLEAATGDDALTDRGPTPSDDGPDEAWWVHWDLRF